MGESEVIHPGNLPAMQRRNAVKRLCAATLGAGLLGGTMLSPAMAGQHSRLRLHAGHNQPKVRRLSYAGYLITGFGTTRIADAVMSFAPANDTYRMVLDVNSMLADLRYESRGRIDEFGLTPLNYTEQRKVAFRSRRVKNVQYVVTEDTTAINRRDGNILYVPPGAQDRLSLLLQVSLLAQTYPQVMEPGSSLAIPFARINNVTSSRWQAAGPAPVALDGSEDGRSRSGQKRMAQRVSRVADKKESVDVAFWLTNDSDRLPLILQFSESGGRSLRFVAQL